MPKKDSKTENDLNTQLGALSASERSQIMVTSGRSPEEVIACILQNEIRHLIQENMAISDSQVESSLRMLRIPDDFFRSPIKTVFHPAKFNSVQEKALTEFEFRFNSNGQKVELLTLFEKYFKTFNDSAALLSDVSLVIDELFTNAIYNAPSNDLENTATGHVRGDHKLELHSGMFGRIFAGRKSNCLLVGCEDPYGTLNVRKMIERIHACLILGADKMMRFGDGGAGIGCYLIFLNSMSLYVGVEKNKRTMLCSLIPLGLGDRKRNEMTKDFHYIEEEET